MQPEEVRTSAQARAIVEERGLQHVKVGVFDNDGILRASTSIATSSSRHSTRAWDSAMSCWGWGFQRPAVRQHHFHRLAHSLSGCSGAACFRKTCRALPFEGNMLLFLGEFAGTAEEVCPRATLRRVLQRAATMGYGAAAAAEYEFFLFSETPASVREKNYRGLSSLTPGYFGYSVLRSSVHTELYQALLQMAADMRMPIEGLACRDRTGRPSRRRCITPRRWKQPTVLALFKTFVKVARQRRGLMATFMAKWSERLPGQSGHLHISLARKDGSSAFLRSDGLAYQSEEMRWFVGGQQALMPELLAMGRRYRQQPTRAWCQGY